MAILKQVHAYDPDERIFKYAHFSPEIKIECPMDDLRRAYPDIGELLFKFVVDSLTQFYKYLFTVTCARSIHVGRQTQRLCSF